MNMPAFYDEIPDYDDVRNVPPLQPPPALIQQSLPLRDYTHNTCPAYSLPQSSERRSYVNLEKNFPTQSSEGRSYVNLEKNFPTQTSGGEISAQKKDISQLKTQEEGGYINWSAKEKCFVHLTPV